MNPSLANFILARTPDSIIHPPAETKNMAQTSFTLNTGAKVPAVGLGTWQSEKGQVKDAVYHALKSGYRHIDAAFAYGNESEVGEGLKAAIDEGVVKREDVFVTSKLWCTYHRKAEECLDEGLRRLGLDYLDLYLMHWPVPMNPNGNDPMIPKLPDGSRDVDFEWKHWQTWKELEKLQRTGKTKAIGVSNYSVKKLEELLPHAEIIPAANQIENHPYLPQDDISTYCRKKGILIEAYSPLGSTGSPLFNEDGVQEVAKKHNVGAGTVLISYQVTRGHVVLPKSVTPSRIEENLKVIKLESSDIEKLNKIHEAKGTTRYVFPPFGLQIDLGFPDKPFEQKK